MSIITQIPMDQRYGFEVWDQNETYKTFKQDEAEYLHCGLQKWENYRGRDIFEVPRSCGSPLHRRPLVMEKGYRLVGWGEKLVRGDEYTFDGITWYVFCPSEDGLTPKGNFEKHPYSSIIAFRRKVTVEGGWVRTAERKPTEKDADKFGDVLVANKEGEQFVRRWDGVAETDFFVFWRPTVEPPPAEKSEEEKDEETFQKWQAQNNGASLRKAFKAALEHARKEKV